MPGKRDPLCPWRPFETPLWWLRLRADILAAAERECQRCEGLPEDRPQEPQR